MASEAFITAQLDIEVDKAREKIAAFVREVQQNPIRVGVEIDRKGDRATMSGQVVSGVDAEHASTGGPSRREGVVDAQAELQRRTLWASSMGGNTGGPTGFIPPTAAMNSVYGSMGHGRAAGPFGTTQVLPGLAAQRATPVPVDVAGQAQSRNVGQMLSGAAEYAGRQVGNAGALRTEATGPRPPAIAQNFAPSIESLDQYAQRRYQTARGMVARSFGQAERADFSAAGMGSSLSGATGDDFGGAAPIFERTRTRNVPGGTRTTRTRGFFDQDLGRFGGQLGPLIGVTGAVALAQNSLGAINARELAFAQAGGDPLAMARAGIDNDLGTSLGRAIPLVGQLGGEISEFFTGNRTAAERTFQAAGIQDRVTASMAQRGDLQRQATQATGVARAGLAGQGAAQIAAIDNLRADIDEGVIRRAYLAQNGQADRDQLLAASNRRNAGASIGSRIQSFLTTGSTAGNTAELAEAEKAYESARQKVAQVEAKADDYVAQIRSANEAQREVIRQSASDTRTTTNQTTEGVSAAFARTVGGDRFGGQQAMLEATIAPQIEQINREIARLDNVEGSGDLVRERVAAREALQQQLDRGTQQNSLDAGRFRILQQGQVQAGRLDLAFNPVGGQLASLQSGFSADTLGMDQSSPDFRRRQEQFSVDVDSVSQAATIRRRSLGNSLRAESRSLDFAQSRNIVGAEAAILAGDAENTLQSLAQSGVGEDQIDIARANFSRRIDLQRQQYAEGFRATQFDGFNLAIAPRDVVDPAAAFAALDEAQRNILGVDAYAGRVLGGEAGIGGEAAVTALTELNQKVERLALVVEGWNQRR